MTDLFRLPELTEAEKGQAGKTVPTGISFKANLKLNTMSRCISSYKSKQFKRNWIKREELFMLTDRCLW